MFPVVSIPALTMSTAMTWVKLESGPFRLEKKIFVFKVVAHE